MIAIRPNRVLVWQGVAIVTLAIGHALGMTTLAGGDRVAEKFFHQYLDLNSEGTPAAYFSALGLLATALVSAHLALTAAAPHARRFWTVSSCLLAFCSLDEAASIHEGFAVIGKMILPQAGIFYVSWWVPYLIVATPLLAFLASGVFRLPASTRNGLIVAATIFLSGALGLELVESVIAEQIAAVVEGGADYAQLRNVFWVVAMIEECLEMFAVAIALRTLLAHAAASAPDLTIHVVDSGAGQRTTTGRRIHTRALEARPPAS